MLGFHLWEDLAANLSPNPNHCSSVSSFLSCLCLTCLLVLVFVFSRPFKKTALKTYFVEQLSSSDQFQNDKNLGPTSQNFLQLYNMGMPDNFHNGNFLFDLQLGDRGYSGNKMRGITLNPNAKPNANANPNDIQRSQNKDKTRQDQTYSTDLCSHILFLDFVLVEHFNGDTLVCFRINCEFDLRLGGSGDMDTRIHGTDTI